jgi:hypothetical protein
MPGGGLGELPLELGGDGSATSGANSVPPSANRTLKIGDDGDIEVSEGTPVQLSGAASIRQAVALRLRTFLSEWFVDEELGIPYKEQILVKNPNMQAIREIFRREILAVDGINSVKSLSLRFTGDRTLRHDFVADSDYGEIRFG